MTTHTLGKLAAFASLCAIFSIAGRLSNVSAQQVGPGGVPGAGGSGGGGVPSVFGRTGAVVAASGDYTATQVTNAAATNAANTFTASPQTISAVHANLTLDDTGDSGHQVYWYNNSGFLVAGANGYGDLESIYGANFHELAKASTLGWSSINGVVTNYPDTSFYRAAAGLIGVSSSTGSTPNTAGVVEPGAILAGGTTFTATGCGTPTSLVGGATAGSFVAQATSCTVVITVGALPQNATHGWACFANDLTTPADVLHQSATSATTATFTGTVVSGDTINFACPRGY